MLIIQTRAQAAADRDVQLQAQLQATIDKAVQEALSGGRMTGDEKAALRDEIKAAVDAAREAAVEQPPLPPLPPFTTGQDTPRDSDIPPEVPQMMSIMGITLVCCIVGLPIARAIGRWIDRRGTTPPAPAREVTDRLSAIEQAVESVAVEVERISEGQRFTARLLSERAPDAAPNFAPVREAVPVGAPANTRRS